MNDLEVLGWVVRAKLAADAIVQEGDGAREQDGQADPDEHDQVDQLPVLQPRLDLVVAFQVGYPVD